MPEFYDGTKLLSMKDLNGNTPEIFMSTSNRNAGKTTYFNRLVFRRFLTKDEKFCLIYRFDYELSDVADKFFKDINGLFFPEYYMRAETKARGVYCELFTGTRDKPEKEFSKSCGYAIALNKADQIKKYSHLLSDVSCMVFDEFQSENNHYCSREVEKFQSIHTSIARGQGKQTRYVPVYMIANPVTLLNPYYTSMDISSRLNEKTKFLRGDGFVLEQGHNEDAQKANEASAFNRAFKKNSYLAYSSQGIYLNDNKAFIEKPKGSSRYLATLRYENKDYAVREFADAGVIYCDDKPDETYPNKISITTDDHQVNYVMLKKNDIFLQNLRFYFEHGCFRFKDLKCKDVVMKALSF